MIKPQSTTIDITISSFIWSGKKSPEYSLTIDGKLVLQTYDFSLIDKEIRKYERLRFKEHVK